MKKPLLAIAKTSLTSQRYYREKVLDRVRVKLADLYISGIDNSDHVQRAYATTLILKSNDLQAILALKLSKGERNV